MHHPPKVETITSREDFILEFLKDSKLLYHKIWTGLIIIDFENALETIVELCDPYVVYAFAYTYGKQSDEARTAACKNPKIAYYYARFIDKKPSEETAEATLKDPDMGPLYESFVERYNRLAKD